MQRVKEHKLKKTICESASSNLNSLLFHTMKAILNTVQCDEMIRYESCKVLTVVCVLRLPTVGRPEIWGLAEKRHVKMTKGHEME